MRLASLEVSGFRGFTRYQSFNLEAQTIVFIGSNGQGKTSLFDAILWGLTGRVQRFSGDAKLLSLFSDTGTMEVELALQDENDILLIRRTFDGKAQRLKVQKGVESYEGAPAESLICRTLSPGITEATALEAAIVRGVYLQQDRLRDFVEAQDESSRFAALSALIGAGRLNDLQVQLDNAKSAWARVTNQRLVEAEALDRRLSTQESLLSTLKGGDTDFSAVAQRWNAWWGFPQIAALRKAPVPRVDSADAPAAIDQVLKLLQTSVMAIERRLGIAQSLREEVAEMTILPDVPDLETLREQHATLVAKVREASVKLSRSREAAAEARKKQVMDASVLDELKALAQIALKHLGDVCPVCAQNYDRQLTETRLKHLLSENHATPTPDDVNEAAEQLSQFEKQLSSIDAVLNEASRRKAEITVRGAQVRTRLQELGFLDSSPDKLAELTSQLRDEARTGRQMQKEGESLALELGRAAEETRKKELQRQVDSLRLLKSQMDAALQSRNQTADEATKILDSLRDAASDIVEDEIRRLEPLLQRIYSRIDPHPAFRVVRLLSKFSNRRGRVSISVEDPLFSIASDDPSAILSSSQLNSLAISVFLALNLGVGALPINALLLDDPLQTLDSVNLLGVIDLLRRAKGFRQLLISTHDERFGRLLERKLRPVRAGDKTLVFGLEGWSREGPLVREYQGEADLQPLKIAV